MEDWRFARDLVPNCINVMHGKTKQLDCIQLFRQMHEMRVKLPVTTDWVGLSNGRSIT